MSKVVITLGFTIDDAQPTAYESDTVFVPVPMHDYGWQDSLATELQKRFGAQFNAYCKRIERGTLSTSLLDTVSRRICEIHSINLDQVVGIAVNSADEEVPYSHIVAVLMLWRARHLDAVENYDDLAIHTLAS